MPLRLKKEISEEEFYGYFSNIKVSHQTLLCFSLKEDDKTLRKLWGHAYNNPGQCHTEILVLREIEEYLAANIPNTTKYSITWFLSYSPCRWCCDEITNFLMKSQTKIEFNIKAARPHYFDNDDNQKGLRMLKRLGVLIKMMEYSDYEECLYLFVDPCTKFISWPDLEMQSIANKTIFHHLLAQVYFILIISEIRVIRENSLQQISTYYVKRSMLDTGGETKEDNRLDNHLFSADDSSPVHTGSASDFESHVLIKKVPPEDPNKTPDKKYEFSDIRTPQKTRFPQRTRELGKEVKRKLF
ncbi:single-stranded DNA cytosine deaminase-like isoform X1 [Vombatus ursinus]|uniref:CMP/dCMP-type deaminase domain-containing protein n=1 Tax=Vombatus ursinus TaxID=29139 RepID=A0A4X2M163_VOMUR|nr:single-stranded DNA cytosine deaminase-like isoform X1 [Vombatus ursinus]XP_027709923.1 single-stranded DNA cytosine deaminase-like isoform X1 [Vombatus ursinus]